MDEKEFFEKHGNEIFTVYQNRTTEDQKLWVAPDNSYTVEDLYQMFSARLNREFKEAYDKEIARLKESKS